MAARQPDAIVCANDRAAGRLMHTLLGSATRSPRLRLVGIDDVDYAGLLPVPLTTLRQPAREIGEAALAAMLDRARGPADPRHPARRTARGQGFVWRRRRGHVLSLELGWTVRKPRAARSEPRRL